MGNYTSFSTDLSNTATANQIQVSDDSCYLKHYTVFNNLYAFENIYFKAYSF